MGKGVIILSIKQEVQTALKGIILNKEFGTVGDKVIIKEFL